MTAQKVDVHPPALYLLTGAVGHAELHVELAVVHDGLDVSCWVLGLVHVHAVAGSVGSQLLPDLVQEETPEPQRPGLKLGSVYKKQHHLVRLLSPRRDDVIPHVQRIHFSIWVSIRPRPDEALQRTHRY